MAIREYRRAGENAEWNVEEVRAYLAGKGYVFGPGGIGTGVDGLVRADIDANVPNETWTADLDAFTPSPDPVRIARNYLIGRYKAINPKTNQQRAQATLNENDLLALLTLLRQGI